MQASASEQSVASDGPKTESSGRWIRVRRVGAVGSLLLFIAELVWLIGILRYPVDPFAGAIPTWVIVAVGFGGLVVAGYTLHKLRRLRKRPADGTAEDLLDARRGVDMSLQLCAATVALSVSKLFDIPLPVMLVTLVPIGITVFLSGLLDKGFDRLGVAIRDANSIGEQVAAAAAEAQRTSPAGRATGGAAARTVLPDEARADIDDGSAYAWAIALGAPRAGDVEHRPTVPASCDSFKGEAGTSAETGVGCTSSVEPGMSRPCVTLVFLSGAVLGWWLRGKSLNHALRTGANIRGLRQDASAACHGRGLHDQRLTV